jgi:hypothetical protein
MNTSGHKYILFTLQPTPKDIILNQFLTQSGELKDIIDIVIEKRHPIYIYNILSIFYNA